MRAAALRRSEIRSSAGPNAPSTSCSAICIRTTSSGCPSSRPLYEPGRHIKIHAGNLGGQTPEAALRTMFSPPLFPIELDHKAKHLDFIGFRAGETLRFDDGSSVRTTPLRHPGGATGYRFDAGGHAVAYVCDFEHAGPAPEQDMIDFVRGCDLVIYDATFTVEDYWPARAGAIRRSRPGLALCKAAGAKRLAAFHHNPEYDDAKLAADRRDAREKSRPALSAPARAKRCNSTRSFCRLPGRTPEAPKARSQPSQRKRKKPKWRVI